MIAGPIVVVGASLAGHWAIETLRRSGFDSPLALVGAEPHLPYDRPPLSKDVLTGGAEAAATALAGASRYDELGIELVLGTPATGLDLDRRSVAVGDRELPFAGLIVATGARARPLPFGRDLGGVHLLRTLDDAVAIRDPLGSAGNVVVVGCGFIGAEVASSARARGCAVTIVESQAVPLVRAVGAELGAELAALHGDHGTTLLTGVSVAAIEGDGSVRSVHLTDGTVLAADLVVVGIGVTPVTDWLDGSGVELRDGLVCDPRLFAAPGVTGAGDVVRWDHPRYGEVRIEHWSNAMEQGALAARNLLAGPAEAVPSDAVPFFWSDQYGHVVQLAGRPDEPDEVEVLHRGTDRSLVALYRQGDEAVVALTVDRQRVLTRLRRQLRGGLAWDDAIATVRDQLG